MIFIRADANENIGTGHVMRCLSVANALAEQNEDVVFVTADRRGDYLINRNGFDSYCLESNWMQMEEELPALRELLKTKKPFLLLVDSYYVTQKYFKEISHLTKLAYFDDMNTAMWDVDYLIDYNIYAKSLDYSNYSKKRTRLLLSPKYAPLRKEFRDLSEHQIKPLVTDILVSAGGSDPERVTESLIKTVCSEWGNTRFHFIVGALNPRIERIKLLEGGNVILHINEQHISKLMKQCDIAVSAAGTTLYELCACGIPTITYTLADNQLVAAAEFEKKGIMLNAGDCRGDMCFAEKVNKRLKLIVEDTTRRGCFSRSMQRIVDGKGSDRIVRELLYEQI